MDQLGRLAQANAERRLRSEFEMRRLFHAHGEAVENAQRIAGQCRFSLDELKYEYPDEVADGLEPDDRLRRLTEAGLMDRYPGGTPPKVRAMVEKELKLIAGLDYARYFLTVRDIVAFARSRGILCQGRGSAANSVVCYALGITEASPETISMVFERFVSEARNEPPDIDVDFEHERREEVIQHIYEKYGRHRAGICSTVIHFRSRAAIREVGKAMGLSGDAVAALSSQVWGISNRGIDEDRARAAGLSTDDRRLRQVLELAQEIVGFPRHLSQHVGGFVVTRGRLDELCPGRERGHGRSDDHRMGQGRHRRARHAQDRRACARHAHLHPKGFRSSQDLEGPGLHAGDDPAGRPCRLRHAVPGRYGRRVPGREPRPDELPAAHAPAHLLRPRHRGRDRPAGSHSGRHGAPLHPAPARRGRGGVPVTRP